MQLENTNVCQKNNKNIAFCSGFGWLVFCVCAGVVVVVVGKQKHYKKQVFSGKWGGLQWKLKLVATHSIKEKMKNINTCETGKCQHLTERQLTISFYVLALSDTPFWETEESKTRNAVNNMRWSLKMKTLCVYYHKEICFKTKSYPQHWKRKTSLSSCYIYWLLDYFLVGGGGLLGVGGFLEEGG